MFNMSDIVITNVNGKQHFRIGTVEFVLKARREVKPGQWVISGELAPGKSVTLASLLSPFADELPLPQELAGITLNQIAFEASPTTGEFAFSGSSSVGWDLSFGGVSLPTGDIQVTISREVDKGSSVMRVAVSLTTTSDVAVFDGFTFTGGSELAFKWNPLPEEPTDELPPGDMWVVSGILGATILDADFQFGLDIAFTEESRTFTLEGRRISVEPLVEFEDIGSLDAQAVVLEIMLPTGNETLPDGAIQVDTKNPYVWSISAECSFALEIVNYFQAGSLSITRDGDIIIFVYTATDSDLRIPLPIPQHDIAIHLGLNQMTVSRQRSRPAVRAAWTFEANPAMWFTELPKWLDEIMPTLLTGTFKASSDGLAIGIERFFKPPFIPIPPITFADSSIPLGAVGLDASNFVLNIGKTFDGSMDLGIAIPEEFNHITGVDTNFFRTYEEGNDDSFARFQMILDETYGLRFQPLNSPLGFVADDPDMPGWSIADFGDFGAFRFMMPAFGYSGTAFNAQVGFEQIPDRPLQIPLAPFKWLLQAAHLDALNDLLPAAIPIEGLDFYNDDGTFKLDTFVDQMERVSGITLPDEIHVALDAISDALESLPTSLKDYLDFQLPSGFTLDIAISTTGGARIDFTTSDGGPLRLLTMAGLPLPALMGIELHSFMLGEILTGALFTNQVDARLDIFDLVTLGAALALPLEDLPLIDHVDQLQRRIVIDKLFMLIVYQTGIPVPIPLFFDELALEYRGLEDATFQTHWNFPMPQADMSEILTTFDQFKRFFTEVDYLLQVDDLPENLDLRLTIGANYLQLPEYLGGKMLGTRDSNTYSLWETIAHALNACKTLSIDEIIQAVPLNIRAGQQSVNMYGLMLDTAWLVTTPREFSALTYQQLGLNAEDVEHVLGIIPRGETDISGLIAFLRGGLNIGGAAQFDMIFGLAATTAGMRTAFESSGQIGGILDAGMSGAFLIEPKNSPAFALAGAIYLKVFDHRVFDGSLLVSDRGLAINGKLDLFPDGSPVDVFGSLVGRISSDELYIDGKVTFTITDHFTLASVSTTITQNGLTIDTELLGLDLHLALQRDENAIELYGTMEGIDIEGLFILESPQVYINTASGLWIKGGVELLGIRATGELGYIRDHFWLKVEGSLFNLFGAVVEIESQLLDSSRNITVYAAMQADFSDELAQLIINYMRGERDKMDKAFQNAKAEVDRCKADLKKWDDLLADGRSDLRAGIATAEKDLQNARNDLNRYEADVNKFKGQVEGRRAEIRQHNDNVNRVLSGYINEVNRWQGEVNRLDTLIIPLRKRVKEEWWRADLAAELAGLELARLSADGFLSGAREALETAKKANQFINEAGDAILKGFRDSLDAANLAFEGQNLLIAELERQLTSLYRELDNALRELRRLREVAQVGLDGANIFLSELQRTSGAMFDTLNQITDWSIGGLIAVHEASFRGALNTVSGGRVNLYVDLRVQGRQKQYSLTFNFRNIANSAKHLAEMVLNEMVYAPHPIGGGEG